MKNIWLLILYVSIPLSAQDISGTIKDSQTGHPVEYATIYLNGTTNGTMSDSTGNFVLSGVTFPCEVVISHVSYKTVVLDLDYHPDKSLSIVAIPKVVEIGEITVVNKNLRENNLRHFRDGLLGYDKWGKEAILENDSILRFYVEYFGEEEGEDVAGKIKYFRAIASAPLSIDLPLLGYDLQYDLVNYEEEYDSEIGTYLTRILGYYYYKPKTPDTRREENSYIRNRMKAYFFSPQHFTRAFYHDNLKENGYDVFAPLKNSFWTSYREFYQDSCNCINYVPNGAIITGLKGQKFAIDYYSNFRGFPVDINTTPKNNFKPRYAYIYFQNDTCLIRPDGTRPGRSLIFGEGLGEKRIGAGLPNDYIPEYH